MTEQTSRPAPYKISGLVHEVHPVRTFASGFKLQEVVVVDDPGAKYPHYVVVEFAKDRTDFLMGVEKGMAVDIGFAVESRYSEGRDGRAGRWFTSVRGLSLRVMGGAQGGGNASASAVRSVRGGGVSVSVPPPAEPPADIPGVGDDDMPF